MPLTKSAKKASKVEKRRKAENDLIRAKIKSAIKGAKLSIASKKEDVAEKMQSLYRELDLAAKKNVIHKNKAARLKSRITKKVSAEATPVRAKAKKTKKPTKSK